MSLGSWKNRRVLITGHTGFKGAWLALWLRRLGAVVGGISLPPISEPNLFALANVASIADSRYCDIRDASRLRSLVEEFAPEVVFHLAAQSLVRAGYRDPITTFATNVLGTVHLLDALRALTGIRVVVVATSDKVYRDLDQHYPCRESDVLGGRDPYSASKAAAEIAIAAYRESYLASMNVAVASARAGNVIGGGDWSEDRLIPDIVRAWFSNREVSIRYPDAVRPWQHVLEPLAGYIHLADELWRSPSLAGAFNFGPEPHEATTVRAVVGIAQRAFGGGQVLWEHGEGPFEASRLTLETVKARTMLKIAPKWSLSVAIERTMHWYREFDRGADAAALCESDIAAYEAC